MNLQDWIEKNKHKEIKFEDGKIVLVETEDKGRWRPNKDEICYYATSNGELSYKVWDECDPDSEGMFEIGNVFQTEEEAEKAIERLAVRAELLDLGGREEFRANQKNFYISGDIQADTIYATNSGGKPYLNAIYFDTRDEAKKAISLVGVHRLKKMLFGEKNIR